MTDDERRALLAAVAAGAISPEEAAARLAAGGDEPAATDPVPPTEPLPVARRIRVEAAAGSVRIVGDPTVATVDVDGEHEVDDDGDTVVVRCAPFVGAADRELVGAGGVFGPNGPFGAGGPFGPSGPFARSRTHVGTATFQLHPRPRSRMRWGDFGRRLSVTIRVNPDLPLSVRVSAGSLDLRGVDAPLDVEVDAGAARLRDVQSPVAVVVRAGALTLDGCFDEGDSTVVCDMGTASIRLDPDSDVVVTAHCDLGRCDLDGEDELVLGDGTATLDVRGSLSSISVTVED